MKKFLNILLIITIVISFCGCKNEKEKELEPVLVEINENNFDEYFYIKADISDFRQENNNSALASSYIGYANLKITISPKKNIKTENLVIKGKASLNGICWSRNYPYFEVSLDNTGNGDRTQAIQSEICYYMRPDSPVVSHFYSYELKENEFYVNDKAFVLYKITGNVYELKNE